MHVDDATREVIRATVKETLVSLGIDADNPIEVQRDLAYLREFRTNVTSMVRRALLAAIGGLVTGGLAVLWLGLRTILHAG